MGDKCERGWGGGGGPTAGVGESSLSCLMATFCVGVEDMEAQMKAAKVRLQKGECGADGIH